MAFFILPQKADLYKKNVNGPPKDRSGQVSNDTEYLPNPITIRKCLFYAYTGAKDTSPRKDYDQTASLYCEPGTDIDEGDLVRNIRGKKGKIFEAGPFEVVNVRYVTDFNGNVHHISCKIHGITG